MIETGYVLVNGARLRGWHEDKRKTEPSGVSEEAYTRRSECYTGAKTRLVVIGNGMAGMHTIEELLKMSPGRIRDHGVRRQAVYALPRIAKIFAGCSVEGRTKGKDAHEYEPLATIA